MERKDVIARIKELMDNEGLTAYAVGKRANIGETAVYAALSPDKIKCPELETIDSICNGLGITLSKFFEFASPEDSPTYLSELEAKWLDIIRRTPKDRIPALFVYTINFLELYEEHEKDKK